VARARSEIESAPVLRRLARAFEPPEKEPFEERSAVELSWAHREAGLQATCEKRPLS
jgi:hypothetical protein